MRKSLSTAKSQYCAEVSLLTKVSVLYKSVSTVEKSHFCTKVSVQLKKMYSEVSKKVKMPLKTEKLDEQNC